MVAFVEPWGVKYVVCVRDVMDVVFSVCIVTRGAAGAHVWKYKCFVMQMFVSCVYPVAIPNSA